MSLADAQERATAIIRSATSMGEFMQRPPEAPIPAAKLPSGFLRPGPFTVDGTPSQRIVRWTWQTIVLVARTKDLPADYAVAEPLIEPVIAAFEQHMSLDANPSNGDPNYFDARITGGTIEPASYGDAQYISIIFDHSVKEKTAVSYSVGG